MVSRSLFSFGVAKVDLRVLEIDVFDAKFERLHQAEPGPVEQCRHEALRAVQLPQEAPDLFATQHHRETTPLPRPLDPGELAKVAIDHVAIEEDQGVQRLILGRPTDSAIDGKMIQESGNVVRAKVARMCPAVEDHEAADPAHVGPLRARAVVTQSGGCVNGCS
jgi:hypothetical protein